MLRVGEATHLEWRIDGDGIHCRRCGTEVGDSQRLNRGNRARRSVHKTQGRHADVRLRAGGNPRTRQWDHNRSRPLNINREISIESLGSIGSKSDRVINQRIGGENYWRPAIENLELGWRDTVAVDDHIPRCPRILYGNGIRQSNRPHLNLFEIYRALRNLQTFRTNT